LSSTYQIVEVLRDPLELDDLLVDHVQVHDDVVLVHKRLLGFSLFLSNDDIKAYRLAHYHIT
jgi:hypothetical protein